MKKGIVGLLTALALAGIAVSCNLFQINKECIKGEGPAKSYTASYKPFNVIRINIPAKVTLNQDTLAKLPSISVFTQANVLERLSIEVNEVDSILTIEFKECVSANQELEFVIKSSSLVKIQIDGPAEISTEGLYRADSLHVIQNSTGSLDLGLRNRKLALDINGTGPIELTGYTDVLTILHNSVSSVAAYNFTADSSSIDMVNSGLVELHAGRKLGVDFKGTGQVFYKGSPTISTNVPANVIDGN